MRKLAFTTNLAIVAFVFALSCSIIPALYARFPGMPQPKRYPWSDKTLTRTGKLRLSGNSFIPDKDRQSRISAEDYAAAVVDELENPRHLRQVLGVVY
jgi:hypothetical protein